MWWSKEEEDQLRVFAQNGATITETAKAFNCSRGAISGKAQRLNLKFGPERPQRPTTIVPPHPRPLPRSQKRETPKPKKRRKYFNIGDRSIPNVDPGLQLKDLPPDQSDYAVRLMDARQDDCRWPLDNPTADMMVCGAPAIEGQSYCKRHHAVAYQSRISRM